MESFFAMGDVKTVTRINSDQEKRFVTEQLLQRLGMPVQCFLPKLKYSGNFEIKASRISFAGAKARNAKMKISVQYLPHSHI